MSSLNTHSKWPRISVPCTEEPKGFYCVHDAAHLHFTVESGTSNTLGECPQCGQTYTFIDSQETT